MPTLSAALSASSPFAYTSLSVMPRHPQANSDSDKAVQLLSWSCYKVKPQACVDVRGIMLQAARVLHARSARGYLVPKSTCRPQDNTQTRIHSQCMLQKRLDAALQMAAPA
jgi:hypothetical protein